MTLNEALSSFLEPPCGKRLPHPDAVRCAYIRVVVDKYDGNISKAARALGLHRRTLQRTLFKNPDLRHGMPEACRRKCEVCALSAQA